MNNSLSLNLLSPKDRMEAMLEWNYVVVKNVVAMILTVTFVLTGLLIGAKIILLNKLTEAEQQVSLVNANQTAINKKITTINKEIATLQTAQSSYHPWSSYLWYFMQLVPEGVVISHLEAAAEDYAITIRGTAQERDQLLVFQDVLEQTPYTTEIYLPLSNLLQRTNINFTLNLVIDPAQLPTENLEQHNESNQ